MVLPQLTPNCEAASDSASVVSASPPPFRFWPLVGRPSDVKWRPSVVNADLKGTKKAPSAAQQSGLRYEDKAQRFIRSVLGSAYLEQPFLHFRDAGVARTCIPDGMLFEPDGTCYIFEIKSQHMPEAWWQLRKLYQPVVTELPFVSRVSCIEIVRSYDPAMGFPEKVKLCSSLSEALEAPSAQFKVFQWRK